MTSERPILFSGPLVRAILDGRKTETRRLVTRRESVGPTSVWRHEGDGVTTMSGVRAAWDELDFSACHVDRVDVARQYLHVQAKDHQTSHRVYCRTAPGDTLWVRESWALVDDSGTYRGSLTGRITRPGPPSRVAYMADDPDAASAWRPSIHMPRWAARLLLDVLEVRAERLRNIDDAGALAEGIEGERPRDQFAALWDSLYGADPAKSWGADPWVWVIRFARRPCT